MSYQECFLAWNVSLFHLDIKPMELYFWELLRKIQHLCKSKATSSEVPSPHYKTRCKNYNMPMLQHHIRRYTPLLNHVPYKLEASSRNIIQAILDPSKLLNLPEFNESTSYASRNLCYKLHQQRSTIITKNKVSATSIDPRGLLGSEAPAVAY